MADYHLINPIITCYSRPDFDEAAEVRITAAKRDSIELEPLHSMEFTRVEDQFLRAVCLDDVPRRDIHVARCD